MIRFHTSHSLRLRALTSSFWSSEAQQLCPFPIPAANTSRLVLLQLGVMTFLSAGWEGWSLLTDSTHLDALNGQLEGLPWGPLLYSGLVCAGESHRFFTNVLDLLTSEGLLKDLEIALQSWSLFLSEHPGDLECARVTKLSP
jgi:hypothetical protein